MGHKIVTVLSKMPARLTFSNSLEILADRLVENLAQEGGDPFHAPTIATPASAARDWLKIRLAEKTGVAVNISFPHLENLLWDRLAERDKQRVVAERQPARLLDGIAFQGLILAQLRAAPPDALKAYLSPEGADPQDTARRLCQLSGRLAALFREYEYNRVAEKGFRSLAESWMHGEASFQRHLLRGKSAASAKQRTTGVLDEVRTLETWQMEIYQALFRVGDGLRDRWGESSKVYRYTLPQYAELALGDPGTPPPTQTVFHLFGLSNLSPFHRDLIGRLADSAHLGDTAVHFEIYALNPCAEYWEDALSLRERRARGPRPLIPAQVPDARVQDTQPDEEERANGELRDAEGENGLLALFGKPGRETIKLWCQLTDHDFREDFREPAESENPTLLAAVRGSMLHRSGALETRVNPDATLRVRRAPDVRAEIEAARAEASAMLRSDPSLRPEDMAILAADVETALPMLRALFAGGVESPGNAPVLLPDGGNPSENPLLRALRDVLVLGATAVDRGMLLAFLDNPVVLRGAKLDPVRLGTIDSFLEAAGFQEGWEEPLGISTAKVAAERALWAFAVDAEDPAVRTLGNTTIPWPASGAVAALEREEAASLIEWVESLRQGTQPFRDGITRSFSEWAQVIRGLRARFLVPGPEDARADVDLSRFLDDIESWGDWEDGSENGVAQADAILIRTLFEDRFRGAEGPSRSSFLRGGIRVGSLMTLRGLPFRHVWVIGLSAEFPASGEAAPLDLRSYRRLPGESDPAARDLYALLETIATTESTLSLSWPAHGRDGGELQPSRALTGLMAWLETDILPEGTNLEFAEMEQPAETATTVAETQPVAWALEPRGEATNWRDLESFLENPALHAATRRFRANVWEALDTSEEERSATLFFDQREDQSLLDPALRAELLEPDTGITVLNSLWEERQRDGRVPPAPYDTIEATRLRERFTSNIVQATKALRERMTEAGLQFAGSLRLGPQGPERPQPPVLNLPAFDGSTLGTPLRVGGIFPWFFTGSGTNGGWGILVEKGKEFPAYLLQLCSSALEPLPEPLRKIFAGPVRIAVRDRKKTESTPDVFEPARISAEDAQAILSDLFADYARAAEGKEHLSDLPITRVEAILKDAGGNPDAVEDWEEALAEARRAAEEMPGARVTQRDKLLRAIDPGVSNDAAQAIRRRALPYLAWKRSLYGKARNGEAGDEG